MANATRRARQSSPTCRRGGPDAGRSLRLRYGCDVATAPRGATARLQMRYAPCELITVFEICRGLVASPRFQTSLERRLRAIRAHPLLNPTALAAGWRERFARHPADAQHEPHLAAAIEWLVRAQDATTDRGIARAYSLGWLAAFGETGQGSFADAARRAARYLVATLDPDGHWRSDNSRFARADSTLYNTRTAWALAEAGARLDEPRFTAAAARNLQAAV